MSDGRGDTAAGSDVKAALMHDDVIAQAFENNPVLGRNAHGVESMQIQRQLGNLMTGQRLAMFELAQNAANLFGKGTVGGLPEVEIFGSAGREQQFHSMCASVR